MPTAALVRPLSNIIHLTDVLFKAEVGNTTSRIDQELYDQFSDIPAVDEGLSVLGCQLPKYSPPLTLKEARAVNENSKMLVGAEIGRVDVTRQLRAGCLTKELRSGNLCSTS